MLTHTAIACTFRPAKTRLSTSDRTSTESRSHRAFSVPALNPVLALKGDHDLLEPPLYQTARPG